jgi:hypothetical protein
MVTSYRRFGGAYASIFKALIFNNNAVKSTNNTRNILLIIETQYTQAIGTGRSLRGERPTKRGSTPRKGKIFNFYPERIDLL